MVGTAVAVFVFVLPASPTYVWTHPTLSADEQNRIKAACEMRAYEAIGGGSVGAAPGARDRYEEACLIAEGFSKERVEDETARRSDDERPQ